MARLIDSVNNQIMEETRSILHLRFSCAFGIKPSNLGTKIFILVISPICLENALHFHTRVNL